MRATVAERYGLKADGHHLGAEPVVENRRWRPGSNQPRGITPTAYSLVVVQTRGDRGELTEPESRVGLPTELKLHQCECGLLMVSGLADQHRVHASVHDRWVRDPAC